MNKRHFARRPGVVCAALLLWVSAGLFFLAPEALAERGISREEARRASDVYNRVKAPGIKGVPGASVYRLEPGGKLEFERRGYCLDHLFSAPPANEPMTFKPMSQYIAPELRELYVRIMRRVSKGDPSGVDVQKIIWAIRTPARESFTEGLTGRDISFLNSTMPGGAALLQRAQRPPQYISSNGASSRGGGGGGRSGGGGAGDILGALLPHLAAQLPFNVRSHSNDLMRQLQNRKAQLPQPGFAMAYSFLRDDGVVARTIASGLTVKASIVNASSTPFDFDTTEWVVESSRDVQAVAMPQLAKATMVKGSPRPAGAAGKDTSTPEPDDAPSAPPKGGQDKNQGGSDGDMYNEYTSSPPKRR